MSVLVTDEIGDIFALMFVDDIARVSDTIILHRQKQLIERVCECVCITLILLKTKFIVFHNNGIVKQTEK